MKVSTFLYLVVAFLTCCGRQISPAWASPFDSSVVASGVLRGGAKNDDSIDNTKPRRWARWGRGTPKANVADAVATISKSCSKIPTLFEEDDAIYDRYAACLAATEGLRRYRNEQLAKLPSRSVPLSKQSNATNTSASRKRSSGISRKRAQAKILASYARDSTKLLNSLNLLTLDEFNAVGRKLQRDASLKAKVCSIKYCFALCEVFTYVYVCARWSLEPIFQTSTCRQQLALNDLYANPRDVSRVRRLGD
jgi:Domain of unknown function (DUF4168)